MIYERLRNKGKRQVRVGKGGQGSRRAINNSKQAPGDITCQHIWSRSRVQVLLNQTLPEMRM
jgi:hypothetical protein